MVDAPPVDLGDITPDAVGSQPHEMALLEHEFRLLSFDKEHQIRVLRYFCGVICLLLVADFVFQYKFAVGILEKLLPVVIPIFTFLFGMGIKTEVASRPAGGAGSAKQSSKGR